MEEKLDVQQNFQARVHIANLFLQQIFSDQETKLNELRTAHAIKFIEQLNCDVTGLASETCLSTKQFNRVFTEQTGLKPKDFIKMIRFQRAIFIKQTTPHLSLSQLSAEAGYFDQSHMNRDFKQFTQKSPKELFTQADVCSDYFTP